MDQLPVEMTTVPPMAGLITWIKEPRARTLSGSGRQEAPVNLDEQISSRSVSSHAGSSVGTSIQFMVPFNMREEKKMALLATVKKSSHAAVVSNS